MQLHGEISIQFSSLKNKPESKKFRLINKSTRQRWLTAFVIRSWSFINVTLRLSFNSRVNTATMVTWTRYPTPWWTRENRTKFLTINVIWAQKTSQHSLTKMRKQLWPSQGHNIAGGWGSAYQRRESILGDMRACSSEKILKPEVPQCWFSMLLRCDFA